MITMDEVRTLLDRGGDVLDADGDKVGAIGQIYLDDATGEPAWVTVKTGLFGGSQSFAPLEQASVAGGTLHVPYDKSRIKDAPRVEDDGRISPQEEDELYQYYGLADGQAPTAGTEQAYDQQAYDQTATASGQGTGQAAGEGTALSDGQTGTAGVDDVYGTDRETSSGRGGTGSDDAMTRSEEFLTVGTQVRESGRARLRKFVVTERETVTVPVSHQEARIEREPITEANRGAAYDGPELSEEEHEIVLQEEVPVVSKEVHPVERVRLGTEVVTEQQQVSADVRKEQIELEDPTTTGRAAGTTTGAGTTPEDAPPR